MTASTPIGVRVRLFAIQREQAGARRVELELPQGSSIEDAWTAIVRRHPILAAGRPSLRFARNGEYAEPGDRLEDGDELAIIPPVSGGADGPPGSSPDPARRVLELREAPFGDDIVAVLADRLATPDDGAVVSFLGRTRESPGTPAPGQEAEATRHAGRLVTALEYEAHETMVIRVLEAIADEIVDRFGVERLAIVHRTGDVPLGEPSVCIVACAAHRDAAFAAARFAIDETKARAPIWKAERFADGHIWIGEPARTEARDR